MAPAPPGHVHVLIDSLNWGGAETLLRDYVIGAREVGIRVSVAYLADRTASAGRLRELGIEPELLPIAHLLGIREQRMVHRHLELVGPDLLHTHLGYSDYFGGIAARRLGVPSVATLHVMEWAQDPKERLKARIMGTVRRRTAARVIAVSEAARQAYLATGWDAPQRVVTVHNGIAVDPPGPRRRAEVRHELGLRAEETVLAMVAVLREGKGHDLAIEAIRRLSEQRGNLRLLIIGDGPDRALVERWAAKLDGRVVMTGFRTDVARILDGVDVLLHPSRVDALPTALIEAAAAGVPAVATAVGGIPEIVEDGETGFLVPPGADTGRLVHALAPLLDSAQMRKRIGSAARVRYDAHFTASAWLRRLLPVYAAARLDRPRGRR